VLLLPFWMDELAAQIDETAETNLLNPFQLQGAAIHEGAGMLFGNGRFRISRDGLRFPQCRC